MADFSHSSANESIDRHPQASNWSLTPMKLLCKELQLEPSQFKAVHVAGTNGKGSVTAMVSSILQQAGFNVGTYTSPHLLDATERILVNGEKIPQKQFLELSRQVKDAGSKLPQESKTSFFEQLTAIAFLCFKQQKVDFVVAETGLGGRLDSTNLLSPLVAAVTNISIEHSELLGNTVREIALEKAGIIKPGCLVATTAQGEALGVIERKCAEQNATLARVQESELQIECTTQKTCFTLEGKKYCTRLLGRHQALNAALAVKVIELLAQKGVSVDSQSIEKGLMEVQWRGRLEIASNSPLVVLDGAHNPAAARALTSAVNELWPQRKVHLVCGVLKDKDAQGILAEFSKMRVGQFIACQPKTERAVPAKELAAKASAIFGAEKVDLQESINAAVQTTLFECKENEMMLVTGSLYTVAEAISSFEKNKKR